MTTITFDLIEKAQQKGACKDGIKAAQEFLSRDFNQFAETHPNYALWAIKKGLIAPSTDCSDKLAEQFPDIALEYFPHLLSKKCLSWCAEKHPEEALKFASHLLSFKQFKTLVDEASLYLLEYMCEKCRISWQRRKYAEGIIEKIKEKWNLM